MLGEGGEGLVFLLCCELISADAQGSWDEVGGGERAVPAQTAAAAARRPAPELFLELLSARAGARYCR